MIKNGAISFLVGAAIALIFMLVQPYSGQALGSWFIFFKLRLLLNPSSILFMADPNNVHTLQIAAISIFINALLYALIGVAIYVGIHRHPVVGIIAAASTCALWVWLWNL